MKKILFSIFLILLVLNIKAFAKDVFTINGSSHLNKGEYDSLEVNGALTFKELFIKDSIVVNGRIHGNDLKCRTIEVNGSVEIDRLWAQNVESNGLFLGQNIDISGDAEFNGRVEIKTGKLHNIQIVSIKSTIIDTEVNGNIWVKKLNNFKSNELLTQILELKGDTIVSGDVVFEEEGEVYLFDGAKIEGKVIKAKVIQK